MTIAHKAAQQMSLSNLAKTNEVVLRLSLTIVDPVGTNGKTRLAAHMGITRGAAEMTPAQVSVRVSIIHGTVPEAAIAAFCKDMAALGWEERSPYGGRTDQSNDFYYATCEIDH